MSVSLSDLATRLENAVPARNDVPFDYYRLVQDGVNQLANDAPVLRTTTLAIVSGTAAYDLPNDFLNMVEFPALVPLLPPGQYSPYYGGGIGALGYTAVDTLSGGLIPVPQGYSESWDIAGGQIALYPTPTYTMNRQYRYSALYQLVGDAYPLLNENAARVALLYAQYLVYSAQSGSQAGIGAKYQIDNVSVDRSSASKQISDQATRLLDQYNSAIKRLQGGYGSTAKYNLGDVAWLY